MSQPAPAKRLLSASPQVPVAVPLKAAPALGEGRAPVLYRHPARFLHARRARRISRVSVFFTFLSGVSRVSSREPHVGLLARDARDQTAKATPPGEPCRVLRTSRRRPGFRERESRKKCRMHAPDGSDPSRAGRRARLKRSRRRGSALQRWLAEETETRRSRASSRQRRVNRKSENGGRAA
ncbi:hypothetical protein TGMAS_246150 [Toxoplasma gondii MAS]|uniref:Uncharacterized protein n=2 Tax=Toxoplasma gondii TaxID=5811 RepID=A0A086QUD1_TOXGO|nr:hypothetical protein TGMAS_246150 [Toxoplasma gondii MAS]PUA90487.1 hypothetical protein TGBR9_246150 [Toxoplasma gondii TgCATBr9]